MFLELNNILDIGQDDKLNGHIVGMSESTSDGSFLLHHFLSLFLKRGVPVCFVTLSHSLNHYNTISQKFGLNLNSLKSTNQLRFVEGLKLLGESLFNQTDCEKQKHSAESGDISFLFEEPLQLLNFKTYIERLYTEIKQLNHHAPVIIIDNLSILLSLGYPVKEIIGLLHYLKEMITETVRAESGTLVLFCDNGKTCLDEENELIWKYIGHECCLQLEVSGLDSGYCKDVHGELTVKWKNSLLPTKTAKNMKKMQFKITDKNVTFFAAGMSSAVL